MTGERAPAGYLAGAASRAAMGVRHGALSAAAAMLAWLPAHELMLRQGFWAAITAIAVLQSELRSTRSTARDQFAGAAIGGSIAVLMTIAVGQQPLGFAVAVVLAVASCWAVDVASAARLAGITTTIILLVPHQGSAAHMLISRVGEVGWGVTVAIVVAWIATVSPRQWG